MKEKKLQIFALLAAMLFSFHCFSSSSSFLNARSLGVDEAGDPAYEYMIGGGAFGQFGSDAMLPLSDFFYRSAIVPEVFEAAFRFSNVSLLLLEFAVALKYTMINRENFAMAIYLESVLTQLPIPFEFGGETWEVMMWALKPGVLLTWELTPELSLTWATRAYVSLITRFLSDRFLEENIFYVESAVTLDIKPLHLLPEVGLSVGQGMFMWHVGLAFRFDSRLFQKKDEAI